MFFTKISLKYFTIHRFFNAVKVLFGYVFSILFRSPFNWGQPIVLSIEPSSVCQLKCPECYTGTGLTKRETIFIDFELYKSIIDKVYKKTWIINLYFQGEAFLHKDIFQMIDYASKRNLMTVISTNGVAFDNETIDKLLKYPPSLLIFSIDGISENSYEKYRKNASLEDVIFKLKNLSETVKIRNNRFPKLEIQTIVTQQNENEIEQISNLAKECNANFRLKTLQIIGSEDQNNLLPKNPKYRRYIKDLKPKKIKNSCRRLWTHMLVTCDGYVVHCCMDKNKKYSIAKIDSKLENDFWKLESRKSFQQRVLKNKSQIDICQNCGL
jgi:radical SAM protein with 4Fe4S-binding SPASM domain